VTQQIDLGSDHWMSWYVLYSNSEQRTGIIVWHPLTPACEEQGCTFLGSCGGSVPFDIPENESVDGPKWSVESWDPLTLSPSLLCHCGDHGWIREGRWVIA
jgi:hypothetical protein